MKPKKTFSTLVIIFFSLASIYAQKENAKPNKPEMATMALMAKNQKAICVLNPTKGNAVTGIITFSQTPEGVKVVANLQGLTKGKHGFHIHECGDCSAEDGSSAGGHFNPAMKSHGSPSDMTRHNGDLGNIEADDAGKAHIEYTDKMLQLEGEHSIIGRSIIIHKSEDDFKTQPTGNSGARVACGVIGMGK